MLTPDIGGDLDPVGIVLALVADDTVKLADFGLATDEQGGTTTFELVLESAPTADVVIPISVSGIGTMMITGVMNDLNQPTIRM